MGTETEGPVDYTVSVDPQWEVEQPGAIPFLPVVLVLVALMVAAVVVNRWRD